MAAAKDICNTRQTLPEQRRQVWKSQAPKLTWPSESLWNQSSVHGMPYELTILKLPDCNALLLMHTSYQRRSPPMDGTGHTADRIAGLHHP